MKHTELAHYIFVEQELFKFSSYCYHSYRFHCFQFVGQCKNDQSKVHVIIIVRMVPFLVDLFFLMDRWLSTFVYYFSTSSTFSSPVLFDVGCVYLFLFVWENFQAHCNKLVVNTCNLFILVFMTWLESKVIFSQNSGTEWRLFLFKKYVI